MALNEDRWIECRTREQRRALLQVLVLNALLSASLASAGFAADSSGLVANALDNASDTAVYAISYYAIGRAPRWKSVAARISGILLLVFAAGVLIDAGRRVMTGAEPLGIVMTAMALMAAGVNFMCLHLLQRVRSADVNVRAAVTFSFNDFVSNAGLLVAGGMVAWTGSLWPDVAVGVAIAAIAIKGGVEILRDAQ